MRTIYMPEGERPLAKDPLPAQGQLWNRLGTGLTYRVMGVVESWIVFRLAGGSPAMLHVNEFMEKFKHIKTKLAAKPRGPFTDAERQRYEGI